MSETALATQWDSREMIDTLKQTVCKGATDAQFRMFVEVCKATGLNPLLKEIWFVQGVGVMAARDGYLAIANRSPLFDGMETRVERDEKGIPIRAICSVWRKDRSHPVTMEAFYDEYRKDSQVWRTYKSAMISKVAEVLALKRSFAINGVVTEEEIGTEQERGSREAQQQVAESQIRKLSAASDHAEIVIEPKAAPSKGKVSFKALEGFKVMKGDLNEISGSDDAYYGILENFGYTKSNQIADDAEAKSIYKTMATLNKQLREDKGLETTLTEAAEFIGVPTFMRILGANGCESITEAMTLGGTALAALLTELREESEAKKRTEMK